MRLWFNNYLSTLLYIIDMCFKFCYLSLRSAKNRSGKNAFQIQIGAGISSVPGFSVQQTSQRQPVTKTNVFVYCMFRVMKSGFSCFIPKFLANLIPVEMSIFRSHKMLSCKSLEMVVNKRVVVNWQRKDLANSLAVNCYILH